MRLQWNVVDDFQVTPLSEAMPVFALPSEGVKQRRLTKGPWTLAGQLLAMEGWRPNFRPGKEKPRATVKDGLCLRILLDAYGDISGQAVNIPKSAMLFSPSTPLAIER
ncbi:uncharacterized protein [Elaeis guineensis]|uniref:Uncharacterized protein LOC105051656 isoform X3 n=1 Tax=Elaeis guineensis var. tenera TaxID=51953 RepID=A0A6I9RPY6_ELAGV|nr:uncharacterized protein LOC105051656 isoform X3 [Elaeis guineensis]